jgi:hypothetical protein
MSKKEIMADLAKCYGKQTIKDLQKNACEVYPELKSKEKFEEWTVDFVLGSFVDLLEEYDVDCE